MRKRHTIAAMLCLIAVLLACKKGEQAGVVDAATPATSESAAATTSFKVGDSVDVEWSGTYYESRVLAVLPGPQYKIHYVGWSDTYDETVGPSRMRARAAGSAPTASAAVAASSAPKTTTGDTTDHVSKCAGASGWAAGPFNKCVQDCSSETDCSKPCLGDWVVSACSECKAGQQCIQVQHAMQDGVGWSRACVGMTGKGCAPAGACRAGWSKPTSTSACMQECPNATGNPENCPTGFVCTSYKTWSSPHCQNYAEAFGTKH